LPAAPRRPPCRLFLRRPRRRPFIFPPAATLVREPRLFLPPLFFACFHADISAARPPILIDAAFASLRLSPVAIIFTLIAVFDDYHY